MSVYERFDVAIIGAGTAGAGAAWQCARRGLRVLCLDSRELGHAGARWVNGVAKWLLDAAEIPMPEGAELRGDDGPFHLIAGHGPQRVTIRERGVLELDMRLLVARLQAMAAEAGAELRGGVRVHGVHERGLDTSAGHIDARFIIDASGFPGVRALPSPSVGREHICAAAQAVHAVNDHAAARAWFEQHGVPEGETLCFTGIAGGYSIVNARLEGDEISILTGSIPALGPSRSLPRAAGPSRDHPSGRALLDALLAEQRWIGPEIFGGARAIPIRRPFDRLTDGRVALLGDAGCQVFSAHGSGIGVGLLAGHMLAQALVDGSGLRGYERRFQREQGGLLAAYDVFRRFSQTLSAAQLGEMMRVGLLDAESARFGTAQRWPRLEPTMLPDKLEALLNSSGSTRMLALGLAQVGARMTALAGLYRAYPEQPMLLPAWSAAVARLVGDARPG